jgi:phosphoenolpyruvate-protein phosphotransferase
MAEQILKGIPASQGIALGPIFILQSQDLEVVRRRIEDPDQELQRLEKALEEAKEEIEGLARQTEAAVSAEEAAIFEAHAMFLQDPELLGLAQAAIEDELINAEAAWNEAVTQHVETLSALEVEYLRERAADLRDVGRRVLRLLLQAPEADLGGLIAPSVIVAEDLAPSDTIRLDRDKVLAFCTAEGGPTSHTAILARSLGVPALVGLGSKVLELDSEDIVAVDGGSGVLAVNPSAETRAQLEQKKVRQQQLQQQEQASAQEPAQTRDGHRVEVVANVGRPEDAAASLEYGAEGIGLLRTEFLYIDRTGAPSEQEQTESYRQFFAALGGHPILVRTLDVGGDKELPYIKLEPEQNPFLGVRAFRLCAKHPELIMEQLRAILRASPGHNVHIMFPMIATLEELEQARDMVQEAHSQVEAEGVPLEADIPLGIMVEIPSVVLMAEMFAQKVDFFSIGTNDLTQYTFAAERTNANVAHLTDACHPAVLRQIKQVIDAGHKAGIWTGICGELAGDPDAIPILLGLGLDEFSMSSRSIPRAKALIRRWRYSQAVELANRALSLRSAAEVRQAVAAVDTSN